MLFERAHFVATTPKPKSSKAAALGLKNSVKEMKGGDPPLIKLENNKANESELKYFEECIDQLTLTGKQTKLHKEEQEDGEEIPDLNLEIKKI